MVSSGLGLIAAASAQTDSFTGQGRLERNGTPLTGSTNLRFRVMDALSGGTALTSQSGAFSVAHGQFTVTFTSVLAGVFNGSPRWVEIGVDDPDTAGISSVPLTPRQAVTAATLCHAGESSGLCHFLIRHRLRHLDLQPSQRISLRRRQHCGI